MTNPTLAELSGRWFDGRSSRVVAARLRLAAPHVLCMDAGENGRREWPLAQVVISPRLGNTPRILRLPDGAQIEIADSPLLSEWFPQPPSRIEAMADWLERRRAAILAAAMVVVVASVLFVWQGIPWMARVVAEHIPPAVERQVGRQVATLLEHTQLSPSTLAPGRQRALELKFRALVAGEPRAGQMHLELVHSPGIGPNAFALPDGRIFMTDELVALARSDEELLAVLAHEAGHHVHRHAMRQALESSSVFLLAGIVLGDVSGSSLAVSMPAVLLSNGFSRDHEREADLYAFALLKHRGHSPQAFADIMRRLSRKTGLGGEDGPVGYLSTHPPTPERIAAAERAAHSG